MVEKKDMLTVSCMTEHLDANLLRTVRWSQGIQFTSRWHLPPMFKLFRSGRNLSIGTTDLSFFSVGDVAQWPRARKIKFFDMSAFAYIISDVQLVYYQSFGKLRVKATFTVDYDRVM